MAVKLLIPLALGQRLRVLKKFLLLGVAGLVTQEILEQPVKMLVAVGAEQAEQAETCILFPQAPAILLVLVIIMFKPTNVAVVVGLEVVVIMALRFRRLVVVRADLEAAELMVPQVMQVLAPRPLGLDITFLAARLVTGALGALGAQLAVMEGQGVGWAKILALVARMQMLVFLGLEREQMYPVAAVPPGLQIMAAAVGAVRDLLIKGLILVV